MSSSLAPTDKPTSPVRRSLSPNPQYAFYGSNSSHSNENGTGGRTYHIPNYATSYANDRTNLINVTFDEGKGSQRAIITLIVAFLLFTAVPLSKIAIRMSQRGGPHHNVSQPIFTTDERDFFSSFFVDRQTDKNNKSLLAATTTEAPSGYSGKYSAWNLSWDEPKAALRCHSFGNKQYTATLQNLPFFSSWADVCSHTPVMINGIRHAKPTSCESKWPWGGVTGHWFVETGPNECRGHWGKIKDRGCLGHGFRFRRYESRLHDIKEKEDWKRICSTASAEIRQDKIIHPSSCHDRGFWGVYGVWEVDDPTC